jgi:hypothetical protein
MRHLALLAIVIAPALTFAEPTKDARQMHTDDCAKARKQNRTCVLDIIPEDVKGDTPKGSGEQVVAVDWGKLGSLIRLRRDFIVEIVKSAEDL